MGKFFFLLLSLLICIGGQTEENATNAKPTVTVPESSIKLEKLARVELSQERFKKTKIGGLSGAFFIKDRLYALSDDRGKINEPRYYVFSVHFSEKESKLKVQVEPEKVIFISPEADKKSRYLDGEAFLPLDEKRFLVSCEGDNNHKPRRNPRLFEISEDGKFSKEWTLPDELLPEPLGLQKKGILNNSGIEGLTLSADKKIVLAAVERPLLQESEDEKRYVHFYEYAVGDSSKIQKDYLYPLSETGFMTGVSELLSWKDKKYFVLERGVRPEVGSSIFYISSLSLIDLDEVETQKQKKFILKSSVKLELGNENFEAMAWGPAWGKYDRTLWILNDNNFSKNEKNVFLVFGVSESEKRLEKKTK